MKKFYLFLTALACFSIVSSNAQMCTVDAGEPIANPAPLCPGINSVAGSFGLATGGFDDGAGNVDPQTTNYIAFDGAGELIDIVDDGGIIDLSSLAIGDMACVYQVAYSQENLNTVTLALDDQLCNVLCDPITGACAGDAIPGFCPGITPTDLAILFSTLDAAFGFNEAQACNLIDNSELTIPTGIPGIGDVVLGIEILGEICADKSTTPYCAALVACAEPVVCDLMAGEPMPPNDNICATGTGMPDQTSVGDVTNVFGPPISGVSPNTPVQDYVIVDPATDEIISVSPTANLDLSGAVIGDMACVFSFSYYLELVELLAAGINDQICNVLCIPDPNDPLMQQCVADLIPGYMCGQTPTDFAGLLDLLNQINTAQGLTNVTFTDVETLCATQMLTINVGDILDVPGLPDAVIDLTLIPGLMGDGFCCDFSNDPYCVTVVDCFIDPPVCSISNINLAAGACNNAGTLADDGTADADDTFVLTINPMGANIGTTYTISGGAMGAGTYGTPFTTTLPADGATITITITDDTDATCMLTQNIDAPVACSSTANPPTTDIPTLSQWGLIVLAMLLMIFGAIKIMATLPKYALNK